MLTVLVRSYFKVDRIKLICLCKLIRPPSWASIEISFLNTKKKYFPYNFISYVNIVDKTDKLSKQQEFV